MGKQWIPRFVIASLLLAAVPGCFVADEMDKAAKLDNSFVSAGRKAAAKSAGAADPATARSKPGDTPANANGKPAAPRGAAWWKTASSLSSEKSDASITRCAIDGRVEFTKHDECVARGGKPQ